MQVSSCLEPKLIKNPYSKELLQVPCGHCEACLSLRPLSKVSRLKRCREEYYDSIFFTLTYNDDFVPQGKFAGTFVYHNLDLVKENTNFADLRDFFDTKTFNYTTQYEKEYGFIPLLSRLDAKYFVRLLKERMPSTFDWFITGEYGPTTFRPHFHGLLFFNKRGSEQDGRISPDDVADILLSCWSGEIRNRIQKFAFVDSDSPLGSVQLRYDVNSSAQYTAAYLNAYSYLPRLLRNVFPPFSKYGRTLPNVCELSSNQIKELLFTGFTEVVRIEVKGFAKYSRSVFPSVDVVRRLFPVFRGSRLLPSSSVEQLIYYVVNVSREKFIENYFENCSSGIGVYLTLYKLFDGVANENQLNSFYYALKRCHNIALKYGVPFRHYLFIYPLVYSKLELVKLKSFYELQEQIADDPFLDVRFINGLYIANNDEELPFPGEGLKFSDYRNNPYFQRYSLQMKKILLDTSKTKKRNDYHGRINI